MSGVLAPRLAEMADRGLIGREEERMSRSLLAGELTLDPLKPADAHELAPLLDDPDIHEFIGGEPLSEPELEARYHRLVRGAPPGGGAKWLNWTIRRRADGRVVGTAQATLVDGDATLAWVVAAKWQGRGYGSETARALVSWAEEQELTPSANVHPGHTASERVAARAGLRPTSEWAAGERVWRPALD
jgi:RimJ/RimL family protein N-acetyltransferase